MARKELAAISKKMKELDFCMMTTVGSRGQLTSRPMSNNKDVEYDGDSWFFTYEGSKKIKHIEAAPQVELAFSDPKGAWISVSGRAKIIRSKTKMQEHWIDDLKQWFKDGLDTPGIVLLQVQAKNIRYWLGEEEGEVKVS